MSAHARTIHGSRSTAAGPAESPAESLHDRADARQDEAEPPREQPRDDAEPPYERVDIDRYAVRGDEGTIGYVEVVPPLFVCYIGHPYPKAEEVAQSYDFHEAVQVVVEHVSRRHRSAR